MQDNNKPSWKLRRRIIHLVLLFCTFCVLWILVRDQQGSVSEMIVISSFGLSGSVIASYIFGAVWDDKNYIESTASRKQRRRMEYDHWTPPRDEELG